MAAAALRQSAELRVAGLLTEPIHCETAGSPDAASACWLDAFMARPTARPCERYVTAMRSPASGMNPLANSSVPARSSVHSPASAGVPNRRVYGCPPGGVLATHAVPR